MTEFYFAGNWKMNKTPAQAKAYVELLTKEASKEAQGQLVILPPALIASVVSEGLKGTAIGWGGQNCYSEPKGAFTGENSPELLRELGASYCLVGHSERRQVFGEPEDMISKKVPALQSFGLIPIVCVGETLDDRRWNRTAEVIVRQLRSALQHADVNKPLWLAYEPVWAIGTGQVALPAQVEEAHEILRKALRDWNNPASSNIPILYGGSVKADNARVLATLKNVNGFLIGGASLEVADFLAIQKSALEALG